jgi:hypothetical protein
MIRGKGIQLRTVREADLDRLYTLLTDLAPAPPEHNPLGIARRRCGASSSPRAIVG